MLNTQLIDEVSHMQPKPKIGKKAPNKMVVQ